MLLIRLALHRRRWCYAVEALSEVVVFESKPEPAARYVGQHGCLGGELAAPLGFASIVSCKSHGVSNAARWRRFKFAIKTANKFKTKKGPPNISQALVRERESKKRVKGPPTQPGYWGALSRAGAASIHSHEANQDEH